MPLYSIVAYILFFVLFGVLCTAIHWDKRYKLVGQFLIYLLLTLFSGLRVGLGRDYAIYFLAYELGPESPYLLVMEPLWQKFYALCHWIGLGYDGLQLFVAALTVALAMKAFERLSLQPVVALVAFVLIYNGYFETMNMVRQLLAMMILLSSFHLYEARRYRSFLLFFLLASVTHHSALFFVPLLLLSRVKLNRLWLIGGIAISFLMGTRIIDWVANFFVQVLPHRYGFYIVEQMIPPEISSGLYVLFINIVALFFIWQYPSLKEKSPSTGLYIVMLFWSVVIYNSMLSFEVGIRLSFYPFMFIYPLVGNVYVLNRTPLFRVLLLIILTGFAMLTARQLTNPKEPYSRYKTVFHDLTPGRELLQ